ncbi:MAG: hypothetical protein A3H17_01740 [Candidatus Levybacteria bacterium RIFCSPLOWO2_12_FULL_37_14]|nr:MAG: hypothetical protein US43_C0001G0028 [Candidatus Levybacteria bacterium GW2011_GWA1_37_16]KKQ42787.1 MAG: hypothetical protein US59_C0004G0027 [Candidatus Levybacteria bacterium GW2011_GWB1_37_8]OGH51118.1 MAG: hypothetical protein A3H17_01740 [Candidatus Levybacteria bacterium RIFCSPLOWO2_12_FULL_37_14]
MKQYVVPNALAVTTAIIYAACRILVGIFPDAFFTIAQSWFHGIGFNKLSAESLTMSSLLLGLISSTITAWVVGYIFIKVYKEFTK